MRNVYDNFGHNEEREKVITNTNNDNIKSDKMSPDNWEIIFLDNNNNKVFYIILYDNN
jgi:hypothetical protein